MHAAPINSSRAHVQETPDPQIVYVPREPQGGLFVEHQTSGSSTESIEGIPQTASMSYRSLPA